MNNLNEETHWPLLDLVMLKTHSGTLLCVRRCLGEFGISLNWVENKFRHKPRLWQNFDHLSNLSRTKAHIIFLVFGKEN